MIVALAAVSAITGGVAGYGTGALMPLVLVPIVGAAPVVRIIAISAMFTNTARVAAFRRSLDARRAAIALVAALPTCIPRDRLDLDRHRAAAPHPQAPRS